MADFNQAVSGGHEAEWSESRGSTDINRGWCLGPFFHVWEKWEDGTWLMAKILTQHDGVPAELWGTKIEYKREGQTRACRSCGRRQMRKL